MNAKITTSARAKINLWLRVLGRREDGFHAIETRMVEIALADELDLEVREEGGVNLSCAEAGVPVDETNLVMKAVRLLEAETGRKFSLHLELRKRIPHGAGLGGGSSDAAAALKGVNEVLRLGVEPDRLAALAGRIGSDVPFFLRGGACDCSGRGEVVQPVEFAVRLRLLLVKPAFQVPTPWAYRQWRDSLEVSGLPYEPQAFPWGALVNDLERPVFARHLLLGLLKRWLREQPGVKGALMSGSGATVFAILDEAVSGEDLVRQVHRQFGASTWTCLTWTMPEGAGSEEMR